MDITQSLLLPNLIPLASILLALSVAYLKLEPFQVALWIERYAEKCLRRFDGTEIFRHLTDTTDYQNLEFLANSATHKNLPNKGKVYRRIFKSGWDRRIVGCSTAVALGILIIGSLHSIGQPVFAQYFSKDYILWWWGLLVFLVTISIILILINEIITRNMKEQIDENVHNLLKIAKAIKARDIGLRDAATMKFRS